MRLARALDDKKYDVRLRDKLVADKKLQPKEVEEYLARLENDEDKMISTEESDKA